MRLLEKIQVSQTGPCGNTHLLQHIAGVEARRCLTSALTCDAVVQEEERVQMQADAREALTSILGPVPEEVMDKLLIWKDQYARVEGMGRARPGMTMVSGLG